MKDANAEDAMLALGIMAEDLEIKCYVVDPKSPTFFVWGVGETQAGPLCTWWPYHVRHRVLPAMPNAEPHKGFHSSMTGNPLTTAWTQADLKRLRPPLWRRAYERIVRAYAKGLLWGKGKPWYEEWK